MTGAQTQLLSLGSAETLNASGLLISTVIFYALLLSLIGLVGSAGLWAVGSFSNNYTQSVNGKKGFLVSAFASAALTFSYLIAAVEYGSAGQTLDSPPTVKLKLRGIFSTLPPPLR